MARPSATTIVRTLADIGVVIGLVMVSMQIRLATTQASAAAHERRIAAVDASLQAFALSDVLPEIYLRLRVNGLDSMTLAEKERIRAWEQARLLRMQGQYHQFRLGFLDELSCLDMLHNAKQYLPLWKGLKVESVDNEFLAAVEQAR